MYIRLFNSLILNASRFIRQPPDSTLHPATAGLNALRSAFLPAFSCLLMALAVAGCATPRINPEQPAERVITVHADQFWQPSGISARKGNIIRCFADRRWGDSFAEYDADGNPDTIKTHLGISAPAYGLLMRIGARTNMVYFIGKETNIIAGSSGELQFRNNFSLPAGLSGELQVRVSVATDTDGDGVSDYDEIFIWKTNPLRADSDGDGFSDLEEISDRLYRPSVKAVGGP